MVSLFNLLVFNRVAVKRAEENFWPEKSKLGFGVVKISGSESPKKWNNLSSKIDFCGENTKQTSLYLNLKRSVTSQNASKFECENILIIAILIFSSFSSELRNFHLTFFAFISDLG